MQKNRTLSCLSLTKMDGSLDLVPRLHKGCPLLLGSWRKDSPGWEKCRGQMHGDLGLRVCVSCVASIYPMCCSVSLVRIKSDNYYYYVHPLQGLSLPESGCWLLLFSLT